MTIFVSHYNNNLMCIFFVNLIFNYFPIVVYRTDEIDSINKVHIRYYHELSKQLPSKMIKEKTSIRIDRKKRKDVPRLVCNGYTKMRDNYSRYFKNVTFYFIN